MRTLNCASRPYVGLNNAEWGIPATDVKVKAKDRQQRANPTSRLQANETLMRDKSSIWYSMLQPDLTSSFY